MSDQTSPSAPPVAAVENGPDARDFSRPHSFSTLVKLRQTIDGWYKEAMRLFRAAKDNGLSNTADYWFNHAASLAQVLIVMDEAISEEAKMNAELCRPKGGNDQ